MPEKYDSYPLYLRPRGQLKALRDLRRHLEFNGILVQATDLDRDLCSICRHRREGTKDWSCALQAPAFLRSGIVYRCGPFKARVGWEEEITRTRSAAYEFAYNTLVQYNLIELVRALNEIVNYVIPLDPVPIELLQSTSKCSFCRIARQKADVAVQEGTYCQIHESQFRRLQDSERAYLWEAYRKLKELARVGLIMRGEKR